MQLAPQQRYSVNWFTILSLVRVDERRALPSLNNRSVDELRRKLGYGVGREKSIPAGLEVRAYAGAS